MAERRDRGMEGNQEMINDSQQHEEDKVLHHTWSNNTPYLQLYHTLSLCCQNKRRIGWTEFLFI